MSGFHDNPRITEEEHAKIDWTLAPNDRNGANSYICMEAGEAFAMAIESDARIDEIEVEDG